MRLSASLVLRIEGKASEWAVLSARLCIEGEGLLSAPEDAEEPLVASSPSASVNLLWTDGDPSDDSNASVLRRFPGEDC